MEHVPVTRAACVPLSHLAKRPQKAKFCATNSGDETLAMPTPLVSIVVPVLRDTAELATLLPTIVPQSADAAVEVIVVNGDSNDSTLKCLADQYPGVRWVSSPPGRGQQMNAGADLASGRWLLFLHADTRLTSGWIDEIQATDSLKDVVGGAFRFTLDSPRLIARIIEWGVAWRVRWLGLPYGDQAVFARRVAFDAVGGYRCLELMEDVDFVRRLRPHGRFRCLNVPVFVSARRWERDGWLRRSVSNIGLAVLYFAGVSPRSLARPYYGPAVPDAEHHRASRAGPETVSPLIFRGRTPAELGEVDTPSSSAVSSPHSDDICSRFSVQWSSKGRNGRVAGATQDPHFGLLVAVIIPALDEEAAIGQVLAEVPACASSVTVVDNGSIDSTGNRARAAGAVVVSEPRRGYGRACLAGLLTNAEADIVVFLDADCSDYPEEMRELIEPIVCGTADFVLGDRQGSWRPWQARVGTVLCVALINLLWGTRYHDLGPFRAIRRMSLDQLGMVDQTWGWTIEMQIKAAEAGLRTVEVPVRQRPRIGHSKITGTLRGTLQAGCRMLYTIWSLWYIRTARYIWGSDA